MLRPMLCTFCLKPYRALARALPGEAVRSITTITTITTTAT